MIKSKLFLKDLFKFIIENKLKLTTKIAENIYIGIVGDTDRFLHDYTNNETIDLVSKLLNMTNIEFDLPSADEWKYAACGGADNEDFTYVGSNDVNSVAWYRGNSGGNAHPSNGHTGKDPNGIDLFDMSGNVAEICNSPMTSDKGMMLTACGGDYTSSANDVTVSSRKAVSPDEKSKTLGFRLIIRKQ